jgi:hypothetical protein
MKLILRALDRVEQARDCQDVGQGAFCVMTPMWKGVLTPVDRIISGDQYVHATATLLLPTNTPPRSSSPAPLGHFRRTLAPTALSSMHRGLSALSILEKV